jgi:hypothetical protein
MNNNKKSYDYGKCHVCGEQMQERKVNQDFCQECSCQYHLR